MYSPKPHQLKHFPHTILLIKKATILKFVLHTTRNEENQVEELFSLHILHFRLNMQWKQLSCSAVAKWELSINLEFVHFGHHPNQSPAITGIWR